MSDGFLAVRAGCAGADAPAEDLALGTSLVTQEASLTARAFVDDVVASGSRGRWRRSGPEASMTAAEDELAAGIGAPELPALGLEQGAAGRAGAGLSHRYGSRYETGNRLG